MAANVVFSSTRTDETKKNARKRRPMKIYKLLRWPKRSKMHGYILEQSLHKIETKSKRVNNIGKTFSVHLVISSSFSERSAVVLTDDVLKST